MLKDIIENTHLMVMGAWTSVVETLVPQPAKREAIRAGMQQVNRARGKYRELDRLLQREAAQLNVNHREERSLLFEKQKNEQDTMSARHKAARAEAKECVRQVRAQVISDISGARVVSSISGIRPGAAKAKPTTRPTRVKVIPVTVEA